MIAGDRAALASMVDTSPAVIAITQVQGWILLEGEAKFTVVVSDSNMKSFLMLGKVGGDLYKPVGQLIWGPFNSCI